MSMPGFNGVCFPEESTIRSFSESGPGYSCGDPPQYQPGLFAPSPCTGCTTSECHLDCHGGPNLQVPICSFYGPDAWSICQNKCSGNCQALAYPGSVVGCFKTDPNRCANGQTVKTCTYSGKCTGTWFPGRPKPHQCITVEGYTQCCDAFQQYPHITKDIYGMHGHCWFCVA